MLSARCFLSSFPDHSIAALKKEAAESARAPEKRPASPGTYSRAAKRSRIITIYDEDDVDDDKKDPDFVVDDGEDNGDDDGGDGTTKKKDEAKDKRKKSKDCPACGKTHTWVCEGDGHECSICGARFAQRASLAKHAGKVHKEGKCVHGCAECGAVFSGERYRDRHQRCCPRRGRASLDDANIFHFGTLSFL